MRKLENLKSEELIRAVWEKATPVKGLDSNLWRMDSQGRYIFKHHYGIRQSQWGWSIDQIVTKVLGQTVSLNNFRPLSVQSA